MEESSWDWNLLPPPVILGTQCLERSAQEIWDILPQPAVGTSHLFPNLFRTHRKQWAFLPAPYIHSLNSGPRIRGPRTSHPDPYCACAEDLTLALRPRTVAQSGTTLTNQTSPTFGRQEWEAGNLDSHTSFQLSGFEEEYGNRKAGEGIKASIFPKRHIIFTLCILGVCEEKKKRDNLWDWLSVAIGISKRSFRGTKGGGSGGVEGGSGRKWGKGWWGGRN